MKKPKQTKTMKCGDKIISKAEKKGGTRTKIDDNLNPEITKKIKDYDLNNAELISKLKKTIIKLESDTEAIERTIDFEIKNLSHDEMKEYREFLFNTSISCVEAYEIDKYISKNL